MSWGRREEQRVINQCAGSQASAVRVLECWFIWSAGLQEFGFKGLGYDLGFGVLG